MINGDEAGEIELAAMQASWRSLAIRWRLTETERTGLLPAGGEGDTAPPADTETRMRIMLEVDRGLPLDEAEIAGWLREQQPMLLGYTPLEVMSGVTGDLRYVRHLVAEGLLP